MSLDLPNAGATWKITLKQPKKFPLYPPHQAQVEESGGDFGFFLLFSRFSRRIRNNWQTNNFDRLKQISVWTLLRLVRVGVEHWDLQVDPLQFRGVQGGHSQDLHRPWRWMSVSRF